MKWTMRNPEDWSPQMVRPMTKWQARRYILLVFWVQFRIWGWHRNCNVVFCDKKQQLMLSVFEPVGFVEHIDL